ncbi:Heterokaryon incompatibility protein (HET) domain containing protein, partial [Hyaloscypha variabilis]
MSKVLSRPISVSPDIRLANGTDLRQETEDWAAHSVEYIALSYCWGHGDFTRLTKANQQNFQEKIPLASLGQTIQDAVLATRKLGFRYLWVDALCILQDSLDDWKIESITMCDVYNNAVCTIAAVSSWNASETMFVEQNPLAMAPCLLSAGSRQWYALSISNTVALSWQRDVTMSRWNTRGWCYQEMALSKIIIFFGSSQIHASTEQGWDNLEVEKINAASYLSRVWWDHVAEYSPRMLTKASDKMVAIAGIAEYMWQCGLKSHYIAGLWEDTLPRDLLWYVSAGIRKKRPDGPRGPSWSWASVDG